MTSPLTDLIFTQDGTELLRVTLPPGEYVVGRHAECDVRVPTDLISRRHARVTINFQEVFIEDLGSSNGTFIVGQRTDGCTAIYPGQPVNLGEIALEIRRQTGADREICHSPNAEFITHLLPPEFLGSQRYRTGRVIAQGGMGAILEGEERILRRRVAIKRMLNSNNESDIARFVEEAQITAQLDHPNIVPLYELGLDEFEQPFYTMKLVRGVTLAHVLHRLRKEDEEMIAKYPLSALLEIFDNVCDALAYAHSKGVLHRDLKPDNIMLGEYGEVMVMDWGLARVSGYRHGTGPERTIVQSARQEHGDVTLPGFVVGSPQYMAPEQARGDSEAIDARSDIYALGATLYQMLLLVPPVAGNRNADEILLTVATGEGAMAADAALDRALDSGEFPHLPHGRIPPELATIVRKAMATSAAERYESVPQLQADVQAFERGAISTSTQPFLVRHAERIIRALLWTIAGLSLLVLILILILRSKSH